MRCVGEDLEDRRTTRIKIAIRKKCPKLQECKTEGARTVLVLESNDIANTNDQVIAKTLSRLSQEAKTELRSVDEMYVVETEANMWCVWLLKYDAAYRPVGDGSSWDLMWDRIEVDESFLIDVVEDGH